MAANATTKIQVSYGRDGSLINVYADSAQELEQLLTIVQDTAALISTTRGALNNASGITANVNYAKAALGATPVQPAKAQSGNACKHGERVWRESKPDAAKPWKGWFCPSPKGTPDQCEPKFVR